MRNRITTVFVGFALLLAFTAQADVGSAICVLGPGATTSPACASGTCDGTADSTTGTFDISKSTYIRVQAYCPVGPCVGIITVNLRTKCNSTLCATPPFQAVISCTNVSSTTGQCSDGSTGYMNVPVGMQLNVQQSGSGGGTLAAILETHVVTP